jgi:hypothetical protein
MMRSKAAMTRPSLHLDMDASRRGLYKALVEKGVDVTRTPNPDVPEGASDEYQLLWATSHQRVIFTHNIKDFLNLAKKHPFHAGIILANQKSANVGQLIGALARIVDETTAESWVGQVRWISEWCK